MKKTIISIVALTLSVATLSFAGWEYTAVTKAQGNTSGQQMDSTVRGWAEGDKAKVSFVDADNPLTPEGGYLISTDAGKTIYLVNPGDKEYAEWDIEGMMGFAGGAMEMMGMKFSDPEVEKLLEEDGPKMSGFPTTHYRFRTTYTMSMNFMGISRSTETEQLEDVWATDDLKDEGLDMWMNQQTAASGNEQLDKLMEAERSKVKGFPLKRIVVTTQKNQGEPDETTTLTTEVTSIREVDIPDSEFAIPDGYEKTEMFPQGAMQGQGGGDDENPFLKMMQQMGREQ